MFKTTICVLTENGYFEEDGIVVNLPFVPQQGIVLRLSENQELLLEAKAKVSENSKSYKNLKDEINFGDDIYVLYVYYYIETNEVTIVLHHDPVLSF
jgi:hypothetical protein